MYIEMKLQIDKIIYSRQIGRYLDRKLYNTFEGIYRIQIDRY